MNTITVYKLTDRDAKTYNGTQWGPGVTHEAPGTGELCGPGWIHTYSNPILAVFLNPIHAAFKSPRLWRCEASGESKHDHKLKTGYQRVTTVEEIPLPKITIDSRIKFAILCAKQVCKEKAWNDWADSWLKGEDRSYTSSRAAERLAEVAWTGDGVVVASSAAWAAADAAVEAERAAMKVPARSAAQAAKWAAQATAKAAEWAAEAENLDIAALAEQAIAATTNTLR